MDESQRMPQTAFPGRIGVMAELDRDRDLDLVLPTNGNHAIVHANRHHQLTAPRLAVLGRQFALDIHAMPGYLPLDASAALALGWQLAPTPISVGPFGQFFLHPSYLQDLIPWVQLHGATGSGQYVFAVPADTGFLGFSFHAQAFVFTASASHAHLTSVTSDTIGW